MKKITINKREKPKKIPNAAVLNQHLDDGMSQKEIAEMYDVTCSGICTKLRRAGYSPTRDYGGRPKSLSSTGHRVIKLTPDVSAIMERYPAPSEVKHADRVTRVTMSGAVVTVRRLTFLDGPFIDGSAP